MRLLALQKTVSLWIDRVKGSSLIDDVTDDISSEESTSLHLLWDLNTQHCVLTICVPTCINWYIYINRKVPALVYVLCYDIPVYGRPLSVSGRPCYVLPMFFIYLFFYGRLILRPWLTEVRESFTRGGPWVSLEKLVLGFFSRSSLNYRVGQKVTKFGVFSDSTRKRSALTPERSRIL